MMFTKGTVVCNELKTKLLLTAVVCHSKLFQPDHRLLIGDLGATKRQGNVFVSYALFACPIPHNR